MARKKRKATPSEPRDKGTVETQRHMRVNGPGTVELLLRGGRLCPEHISAADEIYRVYDHIVAPVKARNMALDRVDGTKGRAQESEEAALKYHKNFVPWINDLTKRQVQGGPPIASIVLDIVFHGTTANKIDLAHRWRKGKAADYLVEGLDLYAVQAGFLKR